MSDNVIPENMLKWQGLRCFQYKILLVFLEIKVQSKLSCRCSLWVAALSLIELLSVAQFRPI